MPSSGAELAVLVSAVQQDSNLAAPRRLPVRSCRSTQIVKRGCGLGKHSATQAEQAGVLSTPWIVTVCERQITLIA